MQKSQDISYALQKIYPQKEYTFNTQQTGANFTIANWDGGPENLTEPTTAQLNTAFNEYKVEKAKEDKKEKEEKKLKKQYGNAKMMQILSKVAYEREIVGTVSPETKAELEVMYNFINTTITEE